MIDATRPTRPRRAEERLQRAIGAAISAAIDESFGPEGPRTASERLQAEIGATISSAIEDQIGRLGRRRHVVRRKRGRTGSVDEIVSLASMGIRPDFIREATEAFGDVSIDDLESLASHGVRVDFIRDMRDIDPAATVDDIVALASIGDPPRLHPRDP